MDNIPSFSVKTAVCNRYSKLSKSLAIIIPSDVLDLLTLDELDGTNDMQ